MAMYDRAPRRIPETLQTLLDAVSEATGTDFNFVLMNFYQDGTHSISYHSDDEKFLGRAASHNMLYTCTLDCQYKSNGPRVAISCSRGTHLPDSACGKKVLISRPLHIW